MVSFPYTLVTDAEQLPEIARSVEAADVIGLDIETTSLSPHEGDIRLAQFHARGKIWVVDLFQTRGLGPIVEAYKKTKAITIAHAAKFEQKWFWNKFQVEFWPLFDTYRASQLVHNGRPQYKHGLWDLYERELQVRPEAEDRQRIDWSGTLTQTDYDYAAEDVRYLPALRDSLRPQLVKLSLLQTALIEFGVILAEGTTELNGFPLDQQEWLTLSEANKIKSDQLYRELIRELPYPGDQIILEGLEPPFNMDSPKQILTSLRRLGLKIEDTREMSLAGYASKSPLIKKFLDYREVSKQLSSFGPEYLENVSKVTNRIHCDYFPFTGAGRYACSKPNLQQIPRDKRFRKCFKVPEGRVLILADYSGIEMRIVAEIADDPVLIQIFRDKKDAHQATASIIMDKPADQVSKDERQMAKPVNFGFIYGMMPAKLVLYAMANYGVVMSEAEATRFRNRYFERYAKIAQWHRLAQRDGQRTKMSRTLSGRLRYLEDPNVFNEFYNTPVQGTGADALKRSLRIVHERLKKYGGRAGIVHHVHDEIIVEADDNPEMIAAIKTDLHDGMIEGMSAFLKKVPVEVEPNHGYSWADAK